MEYKIMKYLIYIGLIVVVVACTISLTAVKGDNNVINKEFDTDATTNADREVELGSWSDIQPVRDTFNVKMDSTIKKDNKRLNRKKYE